MKTIGFKDEKNIKVCTPDTNFLAGRLQVLLYR